MWTSEATNGSGIVVNTASIFASTYDGQRFLKSSFANHLAFKMIADENQENVMKIKSFDGIYDFFPDGFHCGFKG